MRHPPTNAAQAPAKLGRPPTDRRRIMDAVLFGFSRIIWLDAATTQLEHVAEDCVASTLQGAGMLVAKPKFDQSGTDLLAFVEMKDGVKFCRIQCKGRSLVESDSDIRIPEAYVTNGFVVILYLNVGARTPDLYCFFATDVKQWSRTPSEEFRLSLCHSTVREKLAFYRLDTSKIRLIENIIRAADNSGDFKSLVYGQMHVIASPATMSAVGSITYPKSNGTL